VAAASASDSGHQRRCQVRTSYDDRRRHRLSPCGNAFLMVRVRAPCHQFISWRLFCRAGARRSQNGISGPHRLHQRLHVKSRSRLCHPTMLPADQLQKGRQRSPSAANDCQIPGAQRKACLQRLSLPQRQSDSTTLGGSGNPSSNQFSCVSSTLTCVKGRI